MPASAPYPDTLPELLVRGFQRGGTQTAVVQGDRSLSYAELDARSARVASGLRSAGIRPDDRVGVFFANRLESPVVDAAIARAGAVRVPLNPMYSRGEATHILSEAGVEAIIMDPERAELVQSIDADRLALESRFVFGNAGVAGSRRFEELREAGSGEAPMPDRSPGDPAAIYFTGGTTGKPKGVVYSNRVLVRNLIAHLAEFDIGPDDVGLLTAPLSHSAGTFLSTALLAGGRVVIQEGFDVERVVEAIDEEGVTWTMLVPTMIYRLLQAGSSATDTVRQLKRIYYGTAPVRTSKLREAIDRFGPILVQFYGQTEVPNLITTFSSAAHVRAIEDEQVERLKSAGTPVLQSRIRIVDPDSGRDLGVGENGEVLVAAPYTFDRYLDRPNATEETLSDGWVHTGDIGRIDEEGYLYLLDRKANMVTTGGMNVYTQEVEEAISKHPAVADAAVIGIPDEEWGEAVHAIVVTNPGESVTESALITFVGERLADFKKPKSIEIRDGLPRTSLGKIDRNSLRDEYWTDTDRFIH